MGKRGPRKNPKKLDDLRGNPGKRKRDTCEDLATPGAPPMPDWLDDVAAEEWRRVVDQLVTIVGLAEIDQVAFGLYCQAYADYLFAKKELAKAGLTFTTDKNNIIQHPVVGVYNRAWEKLMKAIRELGLSPSARTGITVAQGQTNSPLAEFLTRGCSRN